MKKFSYLFLMICILGAFPSIAISEEVNQDVIIHIETPFYPVEKVNQNIKFVIVNNGDDTFNGTLSNTIEGENIQWNELEYNLTILPHNYSTISRSIEPTYTGEHWVKGTLKDTNGNTVISVDDPLNVHSLTDVAVIGCAIIALLAYIFKNN